MIVIVIIAVDPNLMRGGGTGVDVFRGFPTLLTNRFRFYFFARTSFHDVVDRTEVSGDGWVGNDYESEP